MSDAARKAALKAAATTKRGREDDGDAWAQIQRLPPQLRQRVGNVITTVPEAGATLSTDPRVGVFGRSGRAQRLAHVQTTVEETLRACFADTPTVRELALATADLYPKTKMGFFFMLRIHESPEAAAASRQVRPAEYVIYMGPTAGGTYAIYVQSETIDGEHRVTTAPYEPVGADVEAEAQAILEAGEPLDDHVFFRLARMVRAPTERGAASPADIERALAYMARLATARVQYLHAHPRRRVASTVITPLDAIVYFRVLQRRYESVCKSRVASQWRDVEWTNNLAYAAIYALAKKYFTEEYGILIKMLRAESKYPFRTRLILPPL